MNKRISAVAACILLSFNLSAAHAVSISLSPTTTNVAVNEIFTFDLNIDFTDDATLGGGLDLFYNSSALSFLSFTFNAGYLELDPDFNRTPDVLPNKLEGLAFGSFNALTAGTVGTFSFKALADGDTALSMAVTTDALKGGDFISDNTFGPQEVTFNGADVNVSAVPVPAAAWLFGSGLLGLAGIMRRKIAA